MLYGPKQLENSGTMQEGNIHNTYVYSKKLTQITVRQEA